MNARSNFAGPSTARRHGHGEITVAWCRFGALMQIGFENSTVCPAE
jgi:hypothetical protein